MGKAPAPVPMREATPRAKKRYEGWGPIRRRFPAIIHLVALAVAVAIYTYLPGSMLNERLDVPKAIFASSVVAYAIVVVFRLAEGRLEFDVFGSRMRGAGAGVLLWLLCFGSIVTAWVFVARYTS